MIECILSVMVYGFTYPENIAEDGPKRPEGNPYCTTKIESEEVCQEFVGKLNRYASSVKFNRLMHCSSRGKAMDVIIVRPGDVYGPGYTPW